MLPLSPDNIFFIAVALTAALLGYGISQLILAAIEGDRRRLQERLNVELRKELPAGASPLLLEKRVDELTGILIASSLLRRFNNHLEQAFPGTSLGRFVVLTVLLVVAVFFMVAYVTSAIIGAIAGALIGTIPFLIVSTKRAQRQRVLADQLVDALDFLARILRSGHSLSTGFQMMGEELPEPIATEFRRCYEQHNLGDPLEKAMTEMAARVDSTDFAFFVTAVLIQRQTGGDLSEVLDNIAAMVRNRIRLQQHVKALTAEGRLTGWVLTILPIALFLFMYVRKPRYAEQLLFTDTGRVMLVTVIVLQIIGLLLIRKIIHIKV